MYVHTVFRTKQELRRYLKYAGPASGQVFGTFRTRVPDGEHTAGPALHPDLPAPRHPWQARVIAQGGKIIKVIQ